MSAVALKAPEEQTLASLYQDVWSNTAYRKNSPGERNLTIMLEALKPRIGDSFIDFGCGTGRAAKELQKRGYGVLGIDFAHNSLDTNADIPFLIADMTHLPELTAQFGYCTDVMEHIETERVDEVLMGIARCVREAVFFSIAMVDDNFGPVLVGKQLHLTIQNGEWWHEKLRQFWPKVEIIDHNKSIIFAICRRDHPPPPGFVKYQEDLVKTACNTPMDEVLENVRVNAKRQIKQLRACKENERCAVLVGGGPSLKETLGEIRLRQRNGEDIFAMNGSAEFLNRQGIIPDFLIMIDPRPTNVKFVKKDCAKVYWLASQCAPSVFEAVEGRDVTMLHLHLPGLEKILEHPYTTIGGMASVGLVAMAIVHTAGYREMHLYGYDSSDDNDAAHAYPQELSVAESKRITAWFEGKSYKSSYAMFTQAEQFESFATMLAGHGATITVHGSGLLPDIAREMARQQGEANGLRPE